MTMAYNQVQRDMEMHEASYTEESYYEEETVQSNEMGQAVGAYAHGHHNANQPPPVSPRQALKRSAMAKAKASTAVPPPMEQARSQPGVYPSGRPAPSGRPLTGSGTGSYPSAPPTAAEPSPTGRPVHPLFAHGGPQFGGSGGAAGGKGHPHHQQSPAAAASPPPAPSRPVHPLFAQGGGGGGPTGGASGPGGRPVHPLFAGGGAKNALAAAAANMEKKRASNPSPDPRPSSAAASSAQSSNKAMPSGGGPRGAGGNAQTASLADQVALMAANRRARMGNGDGSAQPSAPAPRASAPAPKVFASPPPAPAYARASAPVVAPRTPEHRAVTVPTVQRAVAAPAPTGYTAEQQQPREKSQRKVRTAANQEPPRTVSSPDSYPKSEPDPEPEPVYYAAETRQPNHHQHQHHHQQERVVVLAPPSPPISEPDQEMPPPPSSPATTISTTTKTYASPTEDLIKSAQLRPTRPKEPETAPKPEFLNVQLRPARDRINVLDHRSDHTSKSYRSEEIEPDGTKKIIIQEQSTTVVPKESGLGTETRTTTTTTTTTVKRVAKDPTYETVEYKVGCVCTIL